MKTHHHTTFPHTAFSQTGVFSVTRIASVHRAIMLVADAISDFLGRARAYNELSRMDNRILRDIGFRRGELDRILTGHPPRIDCQDR